MGQARSQSTHENQPVGALQIFFELLAPLDIAQQQDGADEMTVAVLQRRNGDTDGNLPCPAADKIALATGARLSRRMSFLDEVNQPRLALEDLFQWLSHCSRRRGIGENLGCFVEENNFSVGVERDHAVIEVGEDLFP